MTREEVYAAITEEGVFAKNYDCQVSEPPRRLCDKDKPLELWLLWMKDYLDEACHAATGGFDREYALDRLRCVLSLGVNCAMSHGLPERVPGVTVGRNRR